MERPVAVFDLDALFPQPLTTLLVERMVERGGMPQEALAIPSAPDEKRLALLGKFLKGLSFDSLEEVSGALIEEGKGTVLSYAKNLIQELRAKNYFMLAVSGAPRFLVDGFAYEAGFDKSYGSFFATGASERFTGKVEDEEVITNRAAVLGRAVRKEKLSLRDSVGFAGSASFIPMLEMVETPIAFNPDQELRTHAEKRGWKLVLEEQGVVYKF